MENRRVMLAGLATAIATNLAATSSAFGGLFCRRRRPTTTCCYPVDMRGTIGTVSCQKSYDAGAMMWTTTVSALLTPSSGEMVYDGADGAPKVVISFGTLGTEEHPLSYQSGTTWTVTIDSIDEPSSAKVECRFVSAVQQKTVNCV